jgi:hypothetical protein
MLVDWLREVWEVRKKGLRGSKKVENITYSLERKGSL